MKLLLQLHVATVAVTASYLTLGLANEHSAQDLWAVYATVVFVLAVVTLMTERRVRHDRPRPQSRPIHP